MTTAARVPALSRLARTALAYAADFRWAVVPLHTPTATGADLSAIRCSCGKNCGKSCGKHPRTERGLSDASVDLDVIAEWWTRWPTANVGIVTGARSNLVVIDLDGPDADALFTKRFGAPPTTMALTSRGRHLYFRHPGRPIANSAGALGEGIDVRGDGGYVVAPPSVHYTGHLYAWDREAGFGPRDCAPAELSPALLEALTTAPKTLAPGGTAAGIPLLEHVPEGRRNATLAQYAGRLLAKHHPVAEVFELVLALNTEKCHPPLDRDEVWQIVQSIAGREARKPARVTQTGEVLRIERRDEGRSPAPEDEEPKEPTPAELAECQVGDAVTRGRLDLSRAPRWTWTDLDRLVGPMLPGDLIVVGALTGNGKTSFLLSQLDAMVSAHVPTLYLPLEVDPANARRQWAAWKLGLDWTHVARNEWAMLPEGAQEAHEAMLHELAKGGVAHFPPDRRVTLPKLVQWVRWGVREFGVQMVMLDHFHRMEFGTAGQNYRVAVTEAVRAVKDVAREHGVALIAASQLNHKNSLDLDRYFPPTLDRLKESSGLSEEADSVLMLSRRLRRAVSLEEQRAIKAGLKSEREFEAPNTMTVTCRKLRLDDSARDRAALLHVDNGRVMNRAHSWVIDRSEEAL